jgi:hypothetical protein
MPSPIVSFLRSVGDDKIRILAPRIVLNYPSFKRGFYLNKYVTELKYSFYSSGYYSVQLQRLTSRLKAFDML